MNININELLDFYLPTNLHPNHRLYIEKAYNRISSEKDIVINLVNEEYKKYEHCIEEYIALLISSIYYETGNTRKKYALVKEDGKENFKEIGLIDTNDKITDILGYFTGTWAVTTDPNNDGKIIYPANTFQRLMQISVNENILMINTEVWEKYLNDIKRIYAPFSYEHIPNKPLYIVSDNNANKVLNIIFKEEINKNTNMYNIVDVEKYVNENWSDKTLKDILNIAEKYRKEFWNLKSQKMEPEKVFKNYHYFIKKMSLKDFVLWKKKSDEGKL